MIKFSELILKNFLSHVDTNLNLSDYRGLVLIEGKNTSGYYTSNGSGKSTLLEGIVYALTGDTLRGVAVNDVVNRNYKKNTKVSLKFSKDNKDYLVSRYRKDDAYGDSLVLYRGEENISKRVNKETQKSLEDILNISYKILSSTVLLGEGLSSRFTQLSDGDKKSLIESTLNLNYDINKLRDKAKDKLKEANLNSATIEGEIKVLEELAGKDVETLSKEIEDNKNCIDIYLKTIESLEEEYKIIVEEIESINPKIQLINDTIAKVDNLTAQHSGLVRNKDQYQEERDKVLNTEVPICSMCHQHLRSKESIQSVVDNYNDCINDTLKLMAVIESELNKLPTRELLSEKVGVLSKDHRDKSQKSRDLLSSIGDYKSKIAESKKDIESAETKLKEIENCSERLEVKRKELQSSLDVVDMFDYFSKLFSPSGIIVNILADAISYINSRLSVYSNVLLEKDYHIEFIKGKISLLDSKGSTYQSLSNGEKRRLDIAIQFSLHDYVHTYCGSGIDTMFIDEILDTLDDTGIENIITVLRLKLDYCNLSRIFIISHNSELKSYFDKVITVLKDKEGNSSIQLENFN